MKIVFQIHYLIIEKDREKRNYESRRKQEKIKIGKTYLVKSFLTQQKVKYLFEKLMESLFRVPLV